MTEEIKKWYVLVWGLKLTGSTPILAPGLRLVPLSSPVSVFDLAAAGSVGFREWAMLEPLSSGLTCEIETDQSEARVPGYDALNRGWLLSALLTLRGYSKHLCVACSSYSWNLVAGHQGRTSEAFKEQVKAEGIERAVFKSRRELPPFKGNILDFHVRLILNSKHRKEEVTPEDTEWIRLHYESFNALASESESFRFALEAATDWRFSHGGRSAVARLWEGIECIFGISSELVYRISLMAASCLEDRGTARLQRYRSVKKLYGKRSKIVHGDKISEHDIVETLDGSYELLRQILLFIVERGAMPTRDEFEEMIFY